MAWHGITHSNTRELKVPFSANMTKMPLVKPGLTKGQTRSKFSQNNIFHGFISNPNYSKIFSKFGQVWPEVDLVGPKNPNLDSVVKTGWDQCFCEENKILIPMTIHGSKSELKRLRDWENCEKHISTLPKVITFDPKVGILISSVLWKLDIQSFLGTPRSLQSESEKTSKCASEIRTEKVHKDEIADISRAWPGAPTGARCAGPQKVCQGL